MKFKLTPISRHDVPMFGRWKMWMWSSGRWRRFMACPGDMTDVIVLIGWGAHNEGLIRGYGE